ncbi:hypothetical protein LOTGIDRAFT_233012 [Lottia gigantea]|uniref:Ig-like domain-containing protein n=1 Tax=Lottia gigantea TaxID=225164 RepID=V4AGK5_LOTGI|nr:hypothetical protein LOTGIDRAFT_233012 [Lottia gigantea]ESO92546.1 hypothetical protein LOTGIDRAFT_233012 [Lottia gigantea]
MEISKIIWITVLLFTASSFAEFQFKVPTENCVYGTSCFLTCGTIDRSKDVQFLHGGKPLLTCLARNYYESPCLIVPDSQGLGYRTYYDSMKSEIQIKITIKENDNANWTCKNGNQEASVHVNAGYTSFVTKFTTWNNIGYDQEVGQEVNLVCQVGMPYGSNYDPTMVSTSITRNSDASNLTTTVSKGYFLNYRATTKLKCTDHFFTCLTWTGFGKLSSNTVEVNVKCPLQIFYDMITTNVTVELGNHKGRYLELYYSGYPVTTRWYKNFPEGDKLLNYIDEIGELNIRSRKEVLFINAKLDDAGQYTVYVRQNDTVLKVVYHVTVVMPTTIHKTSTNSRDFSTSSRTNSRDFSTSSSVTTHTTSTISRSEQPKSKYTTNDSRSTQINKSTTKDSKMELVTSKDNNGSCQQLSSLMTLVVLAFLSFNFL